MGYESRQVFDIKIARVVTEYLAQILEDSKGNRFVAPFPADVTKAVQYGKSVKAHSVYMSQFQLIPYNRVQDHFKEQLQIPISSGSIYNFNREAYNLLGEFEEKVKSKLAESALMHVDETSINIGGERHWLHCTSNDLWTYFFPHKKRGAVATEAIGILPKFTGILCHDHWKPYYTYECVHSLCNAHHLRELTRAWEPDNQKWAKRMKALLENMNHAVNDAGGQLGSVESKRYRYKYGAILKRAEAECPPPDKIQREGKGEKKKIKSEKSFRTIKRF